MSLGVSPNTPSPLLTRPPKPIADHRRRTSVSASERATVLGRDPAMSQAGVFGGLRERSEDELRRASREEVEAALRDEWNTREQLLERLNVLEADQRNLQFERTEMAKVLGSMQAKVDEAFNEQNRLEADLEERDQVLDRLRARGRVGERVQRDLQKRCAEQELAFEAEREAFRAHESQLQSRINTLRSQSRLDAQDRRATTKTVAADNELETLQASHAALLARLNTLSRDLLGLKARNVELEEDNAGWELLMQERTMSGAVLDGGLFQVSETLSPPQSPVREKRSRRKSRKDQAELEKLDEETELEEEMDDLHGDLEMQSPILGDGADSFTGGRRMTGEGAKQVDALLAPPGASSRRAKGGNMDDVPGRSSELDLAAELGRAEVDLDGNEVRVQDKGEEGQALRAEVKQLKEANKALTLYCSKIIDRIISQEGFEHVLSVDYKTRRGLRNISVSSAASGVSCTMKKPKTRPSLRDITQTTQEVIPAPAPVPLEDEPPKKEKKARPLSMMFRASPSAGEIPEAPKEDAKMSAAVAPDVEETKAEKRARRGFSLDLRSFGFGNTPIESPKPRLKPLALSKRTTTLPNAPKPGSSPSVTPASSIGHSIARKCDVEEEDENDRRERHRMEASLKLMGIDRTPSPSMYEEAGGDLWGGSLGHSSSRGSGPIPSRSETGPRTSASSAAPSEVLPRRHEATGTASPRRAMRRHHVEGGKVVKSESISTLWSMGSGGSRPGSGEVGANEVEQLR